MFKLLRGLVVLAIIAGVGFFGLSALARLSDGPIGPLPGGELIGGDWWPSPLDDWSFAADFETIELQLTSQETSRTTGILVNHGVVYIPCVTGFPPGKDWHNEARRNGGAILRMNGFKYPVSLSKVEDPGLADTLESIFADKYAGGPPGDSEIWFFRADWRG